VPFAEIDANQLELDKSTHRPAHFINTMTASTLPLFSEKMLADFILKGGICQLITRSQLLLEISLCSEKTLGNL